MNLESYFVDFVTLNSLVLLISEFLGGRLPALFGKPQLDGVPAKILSFVVAQGAVWLGWFLGYAGVLVGIQAWWVVVLYGLGIGVTANGMFSFETVKWVLELIRVRVAKEN